VEWVGGVRVVRGWVKGEGVRVVRVWVRVRMWVAMWVGVWVEELRCKNIHS